MSLWPTLMTQLAELPKPKTPEKIMQDRANELLEILAYLEQGAKDTREIANYFNVTPDLIRARLNRLKAKGKIRVTPQTSSTPAVWSLVR